MKVMIVKELMTGDVSPVAMFFTVLPGFLEVEISVLRGLAEVYYGFFLYL